MMRSGIVSKLRSTTIITHPGIWHYTSEALYHKSLNPTGSRLGFKSRIEVHICILLREAARCTIYIPAQVAAARTSATLGRGSANIIPPNTPAAEYINDRAVRRPGCSPTPSRNHPSRPCKTACTANTADVTCRTDQGPGKAGRGRPS